MVRIAWLSRRLPLIGVLLLAACATAPDEPDHAAVAPLMPAMLSEWSARTLPGKRATQYSFAQRGEQACLLAKAHRSVSLWRRTMNLPGADIAAVQFDWWIAALDGKASVVEASTDDAPARLLLGFEGDEAGLSMRNRMQFELVRTLTGEAPPYATLMYVWDASAPPETVVISTRSDRIRKIVVGSGQLSSGRWLRLRRDVRADFERAFGEAPGRLISMAMMTDGDNTSSRAEACYGNVVLFGADGRVMPGSLLLQ